MNMALSIKGLALILFGLESEKFIVGIFRF